MVIRVAFVQFRDGAKSVKSIDDFKDFLPRSSEDFQKTQEYEVLWELEDGSSDYFPAKIISLASSDSDLIAKEKEQKKWKLPASYVAKVQSSLDPNKTHNEIKKEKVSTERKRKNGAISSAKDKRMKAYLEASKQSLECPWKKIEDETLSKDTIAVQKHAEKTFRKETKTEEHAEKICIKENKTEKHTEKTHGKEKKTEEKLEKSCGKEKTYKHAAEMCTKEKNTEKHKEKACEREKKIEKHAKETCRNENRTEGLAQEDDIISDTDKESDHLFNLNPVDSKLMLQTKKRLLFGDDDSDSSAPSSSERLVSSTELQEAINKIKRLELALKSSFNRRQKVEEKLLRLEVENKRLTDKVQCLRKLNSQLMDQLLDPHQQPAEPVVKDLTKVNAGDNTETVITATKTMSLLDYQQGSSDVDADCSAELPLLCSTTPALPVGQTTFDEQRVVKGRGDMKVVDATSKKRPQQVKQNKDGKRVGVEDIELQSKIAARILLDMNDLSPLEIVKNRVHLGEEVYVDYNNWTQVIKASGTDSAFVGSLLRAMWGRRVLGTKTMKGGKAKNFNSVGPSASGETKQPLTPKKLDVFLGALQAYYMKNGIVQGAMLNAALANGKKIVSSKLNDDARWLRSQTLQKQADGGSKHEVTNHQQEE